MADLSIIIPTLNAGEGLRRSLPPLADFDARRDQAFWDGLMDLVPVWDDMIDAFNT